MYRTYACYKIYLLNDYHDWISVMTEVSHYIVVPEKAYNATYWKNYCPDAGGLKLGFSGTTIYNPGETP